MSVQRGRIARPVGTPDARPVRCKRAEWYLVRARLVAGVVLRRSAMVVSFMRGSQLLSRRCVPLHAGGPPGELLGWFRTPADVTHLRLALSAGASAGQFAELALHVVAERDPKCHPLANVPRWSTYRTSFTVRRVILPASLAGLRPLLAGMEVRVLAAPASLDDLARQARGAACVLDPRWVCSLRLGLSAVERVAAASWLIVDLETLAGLVTAAGAADVRPVRYADQHGLMSARVEYADVPTRGFALQDVVPYATIDARGRFVQRGLKPGRAWKRYADEVGFATLLSGETPWADRHGAVLSAMRAVGGGELLATDLPWLLAGEHGTLVAPRVAAHLLRTHVALPVADCVQFWNRWDDGDTVVRDLADLARRYAPLHAVRWASPDPACAHLGIVLHPSVARPKRHLVIRTGRIDNLDAHDGLPAEPMAIFMKWLAREAREQTAWAQTHLARQIVTWQFDTASGLKYAANFDAADACDVPPTVVRVRLGAAGSAVQLPDDEGLHGDGSIEFQERLACRLQRLIEGR